MKLKAAKKLERLGTRFLYGYEIMGNSSGLFEGQVMEISPSSKYIKISGMWFEIEKVTVIEELV